MTYIVYAFVLVLVAAIFFLGAILIFSIYDAYGMCTARIKFREFCNQHHYLVDKLSAIISKMDDCPPIAKDALPTEVFVWCNVHVLIVGNRKGKPLILFLGHPLDKADAENPIFKMYCRMHGMSASKAKTYMGILAKENFKEQIKEKEENNLKNHFTV